MAEDHWKYPDDADQVLYVIKHGPKGYKKSYLAQTLTEMEEQLIVCINCEGVMRDACIFGGEITCKLCRKRETKVNFVNKVRALVDKLRIKCPLLRDCEWTGQLSEAEEHVGVCGSALVSCPLGCEEVGRRSQSEEHTSDKCQFRKITCNFCGTKIQFINHMNHVEVCPDQPIQCECEIEIPRSKMDMHIETECPLAEVECPYAKYSCHIGKLYRKDLLAHKQEFYIEHQDMLEEENSKLKEAMRTKKELTEAQIYINLKDTDNNITEHEFIRGNNKLRCHLLAVDPIQIIIIMNDTDAVPFLPMFGSNRDKSFTEIHECRLILDKTNRKKESYFVVIKLNPRVEGDNIIKLQKEIYSQYIKEDGTLLIRLFFDI